MSNLSYAYRVFSHDQIEERLNEARSRGWELHTFCDATEETWPSAVFHWVGRAPQCLPFADDEEATEETAE